MSFENWADFRTERECSKGVKKNGYRTLQCWAWRISGCLGVSAHFARMRKRKRFFRNEESSRIPGNDPVTFHFEPSRHLRTGTLHLGCIEPSTALLGCSTILHKSLYILWRKTADSLSSVLTGTPKCTLYLTTKGFVWYLISNKPYWIHAVSFLLTIVLYWPEEEQGDWRSTRTRVTNVDRIYPRNFITF